MRHIFAAVLCLLASFSCTAQQLQALQRWFYSLPLPSALPAITSQLTHDSRFVRIPTSASPGDVCRTLYVGSIRKEAIFPVKGLDSASIAAYCTSVQAVKDSGAAAHYSGPMVTVRLEYFDSDTAKLLRLYREARADFAYITKDTSELTITSTPEVTLTGEIADDVEEHGLVFFIVETSRRKQQLSLYLRRRQDKLIGVVLEFNCSFHDN